MRQRLYLTRVSSARGDSPDKRAVFSPLPIKARLKDPHELLRDSKNKIMHWDRFIVEHVDVFPACLLVLSWLPGRTAASQENFTGLHNILYNTSSKLQQLVLIWLEILD